jgi:hypothetical protein
MKIAASLVLVLVLAAASCGHKADAPDADPPSVHVATVTKGALTEWVRLSGKLYLPGIATPRCLRASKASSRKSRCTSESALSKARPSCAWTPPL